MTCSQSSLVATFAADSVYRWHVFVSTNVRVPQLSGRLVIRMSSWRTLRRIFEPFSSLIQGLYTPRGRPAIRDEVCRDARIMKCRIVISASQHTSVRIGLLLAVTSTFYTLMPGFYARQQYRQVGLLLSAY